MQIFYNGLNYLTRALVDAACGGSITMKTTRETNLMFEELAKNNYQPLSKIGDGRRQGGLHEVDTMSSLEAKFEAFKEIAYMKAQSAFMANPPLQI